MGEPRVNVQQIADLAWAGQHEQAIAAASTALESKTVRPDERTALLQGTLDLLILKTLIYGPQHGQGIARAIQDQSAQALIVDHGSLYPALQRLEERRC